MDSPARAESYTAKKEGRGFGSSVVFYLFLASPLLAKYLSWRVCTEPPYVPTSPLVIFYRWLW